MINNKKNLIVLSTSILASILILEFFLRIYNPFPFRLKGDKIFLPTGISYHIKNTTIPGLDSEITHTKNSLGFRGPEIPQNFDKYLSIIAVGGSTTECYYISDDKTWPYLLGEKLENDFDNVWVNNAGLDGHSTFGHKILLQDYIIKIKPKVVLFFAGLNDICSDNSGLCPGNNLVSSIFSKFKNYLAQKSEIVNILINISRVIKARELGVIRKGVNLLKVEKMEISEVDMQARFFAYTKNVAGFKDRIEELVKISKENSIIPILITQPMLWGEENDIVTGADLENIKIDNVKNGKLYWNILQFYNDKIRQVGKDDNILVIDLANEMPKNSLYYYDGVHYTNMGATQVSEILSTELTKYFKENFENNIKNK